FFPKHNKDSLVIVQDVCSVTVCFLLQISAIRTVVPNRSNNEIVLVLQHFENNVDKAVQAFVDGSAVVVLREWNIPGKKKHNKKRKSKPKPDSESGKDERGHGDRPETAVELPRPKGGLNGYHGNGSANDGSSVESLNETLETVSNPEKETLELFHEAPFAKVFTLTVVLTRSQDHKMGSAKEGPSAHWISSLCAALISPCLTTGPYIEKSMKDLQRCTVSLARYQLLIKEEMDASVKKIKVTFGELQTCIMDREVALMSELDKIKKEALEILDSRQRRAEELKRLTDVAIQMSESQLAELRAEIKHFVSDRKYDEELGRSARFTGSPESLGAQIQQFGEGEEINLSSDSLQNSPRSSTAITTIMVTSCGVSDVIRWNR
uniref:Spermatogenesis associated serine rich 2 like n=1 Tax=Callorhinchus milii TaxID=7868 RepID=A0A4W3IHI9_CALMI